MPSITIEPTFAERRRVVPQAFAQAAGIKAGRRARVISPESASTSGGVVLMPRLDVLVPTCIIEAALPGTEWRVSADVVTAGGAALIAALRVFPDVRELPERPPGLWLGDVLGVAAPCPRQGITTAVLRAVPLKALYAGLEGAVRQVYGELGPRAFLPDTRWTQLGLRPRQGAAIARRLPRRRIPDVDLAIVAAAFVAAVDAGSRKPVADAARQLGRPTKRVRDLIHQARQRGLLVPKTLGQGSREGGRLTPAARRLLDLPTTTKAKRRTT